jgi:hypothetical protein
MLHPAIWRLLERGGFYTIGQFDALQDYSYFVELYVLVYGERTTDIPSLEEQHRQHQFRTWQTFLQRTISYRVTSSETRMRTSATLGLRHALARKLTLVSVLSRGLVADRKLWHWIEDAVTRWGIVGRKPRVRSLSAEDLGWNRWTCAYQVWRHVGAR